MTLPQPRANAVRFIVCLGLVSLFADKSYEVARSFIGPFLQDLGASAAVVGLIADVVGSEALLKSLCKLRSAEELGVSVSQMRAICGKSDVWKGLGAMLAYMIRLSTTHAPNYRKHKKLPVARDLWQALYLGVVEGFVTGDELMLDAISPHRYRKSASVRGQFPSACSDYSRNTPLTAGASSGSRAATHCAFSPKPLSDAMVA
jgi:hypothetical protein